MGVPLAWAVLLLLPLPAGPADRLMRCIAAADRDCLARELKTPPARPSAEYLSAAAEANLLLGRNAGAVAAIGKAVGMKPGDYDLLLQQGRTYQRCGDQVNAIQAFLLAAKARPPDAVIFYNLGLSFFLLHEYERAGRHFHHAVELDSNDAKAEFMLAVIQIVRDGNNAVARTHLERALALDPENPHYLLHYGIVLAQEDDSAKAAVVLEQAVKADPGNPLAHFNFGRLLRRQNDLDGARRELEEAVRRRPDLARAHYQLAAVYRALHETEKARSSLELFNKYKEADRDDDPVDGPPSYAFKDQPPR